MEKAFLLVNSVLLTVKTMIMRVSSRLVAREDLKVAIKVFAAAFLFSLLLLLLSLLLLLLLLLSFLLSLLFNFTYTCLKLTRIKPYFFSQNKSVIKLMQVFFSYC